MWQRQNYGYRKISYEITQSLQFMKEISAEDLVVGPGEAQKHIYQKRLMIQKLHDLLSREKARKREINKRKDAYQMVTKEIESKQGTEEQKVDGLVEEYSSNLVKAQDSVDRQLSAQIQTSYDFDAY